jgi:lincosamide nucleotidyltransferase
VLDTPQHRLLERIRSRAEASPEVVGLLVLGSLAAGVADEHSDLDLGLYVADDAIGGFDLRRWLDPIEPVAAIFEREHSSTVLFRSLLRAEIHFGPISRADEWTTMAGLVAYPDVEHVLLLDRTGTLRRRVGPLVGSLPRRGAGDANRQLGGLVDALLAADACRRRGELAAALAQLSSAHEPLLRLARIAEGATQDWVAPARRLELALPAAAYRRYALSTARPVDRQLRRAIRAAWSWARELAATTGATVLTPEVVAAIDGRLAALPDRP